MPPTRGDTPMGQQRSGIRTGGWLAQAFLTSPKHLTVLSWTQPSVGNFSSLPNWRKIIRWEDWPEKSDCWPFSHMAIWGSLVTQSHYPVRPVRLPTWRWSGMYTCDLGWG